MIYSVYGLSYAYGAGVVKDDGYHKWRYMKNNIKHYARYRLSSARRGSSDVCQKIYDFKWSNKHIKMYYKRDSMENHPRIRLIEYGYPIPLSKLQRYGGCLAEDGKPDSTVNDYTRRLTTNIAFRSLYSIKEKYIDSIRRYDPYDQC